jgi:hypothetical protein
MNVKLITPLPPCENIDEEEQGRAMFQLIRDWDIYVDGHLWTFGAGLKTDFASIPRMFWRLFNPTDIHLQAASFYHDMMYKCHAPRGWADDAFRAIAEARGMNKLQSNTVWAAVRVGGKWSYDSNNSACQSSTRAVIRRDGEFLPANGWVK